MTRTLSKWARTVLLLAAIAGVLALAGCANFWQSPTGATNSTVTLTASPTTVSPGASVSLTATVSPSAATGTITFYNGSTSLGTGTLSSGTATLTVTFSATGTDTLTASYSGDSNYASSTSSGVTVTVSSSAASATLLTASTTTPDLGAPVTLKASVTPTEATQTVAFFNGSASLGNGTLDSSGTATQTANFYSPGTQTLTATYNGDSSHTGSVSSDITVTVGSPGSTQSTTALNVSPASISAGSNVLLTATVSPSTATGQITFYNGTAVLGTALLSSGSASLTQPFPTAGTQVLKAVYSGDPIYSSSTSASEPLTVASPGP